MPGRQFTPTSYRYGFNGKEKDNEIKNVDGSSLDFGARIYDSRLGRFLSVDPLSGDTPQWSPYAAFACNPVFYVDPNGKKYLNFDAAGNYTGTSNDNWFHNTFFGTKGRISDAKGAYTTFSFGDTENDVKDIQNGIIKKVIVVKEKQIQVMIKNSGAFDDANRTENKPITDRYDFILKEGKGDGGSLDFSYSQIPNMFSEASRDPLNSPSKVMFLVTTTDESKVAYNHMDFGNFLFGAAGYSLGYTEMELKAGAHYNSLVNSKENNYPSQFDSNADQSAIGAGVFHAEGNDYRNKSAKKTDSTIKEKR